MIVTEKGKYKLLKDFKVRNSIAIGTLEEGDVLEITQIDELTNKVIGPELMDWANNELPVEKIE
ncbi:hypothetical protein LCGC14_2225220 [marine sediment metagenome]|uniref:Uncharacterized protein n=1 Tax=marine sediment metagenome TaxID=412755 RepID=A0A0F9D9W8_9ZZZZ